MAMQRKILPAGSTFKSFGFYFCSKRNRWIGQCDLRLKMVDGSKRLSSSETGDTFRTSAQADEWCLAANIAEAMSWNPTAERAECDK